MPPPLPPRRNTPPPIPVSPPLPPLLPPRPPSLRQQPAPRKRMGAFGWLFVMLGVLVAVLCVQKLSVSSDEPSGAVEVTESVAGKRAFEEANSSIMRFHNKEGFGNTPEAERLAARFARDFQQVREKGFTSGKKRIVSLSRGQFIAFCRVNQDSCVFLVHVPELRRFDAEAKTALAEVAWLVAHELAQETGLPIDARMVVGVKGAINYEAIFIGGIRNLDDPLKDVSRQERGFGFEKETLFYPFFADVDSGVKRSGQAARADLVLPVAVVAPNKPSSYREYRALVGEGLQGSAFVVQAYGLRWAVMSRHQFEDDAVPKMAVSMDLETVLALSPDAVLRQNDVQIIPLTDQAAVVPYLEFDPLFELESGDKFWIEHGDGKQGTAGTTGTLLAAGLKRGRYHSLDGPARLKLQLDVPANVAGGSGAPIISVKTGRPVGVLSAADNGGVGAQRITFEPLCMVGKIPGKARTDAEISTLMIGKWTEHFVRNGWRGASQTSFDASGAFSTEFSETRPKNSGQVSVKGRWKIEGGKLIYSELISNDPEYPPDLISDTIVELGERHLVYLSEKSLGLKLMRKSDADAESVNAKPANAEPAEFEQPVTK